MRLIDTDTLILHEYNEASIPPYAILSHTWGENEVSFEQMTTLSHNELAKVAGYDKIQRCSSQARNWNLRYTWVDTCCIDKKSSSELSEAINSMYRWYQNSAVCFAHLADVEFDPPIPPQFFTTHVSHKRFDKARWFTRGWCLQALLAPAHLHFFDKNWTHLGSKLALRKVIIDITGIDELSLFTSQMSTVSVASKMSWAGKRSTTRVEDIAYCLLGIFDVNMPLLYGEGEKAFIRLQEEIIKQTEDHSIFAWHSSDDSKNKDNKVKLSGFLAKHPSAFCKPFPRSQWNPGQSEVDPVRTSETWSVTSRGIRIELPVLAHSLGAQAGYLAGLGCRESSSHLALFLNKVDGRDDLYSRHEHGIWKLSNKEAEDIGRHGNLKTIYLLKGDVRHQLDHTCWLRTMDMNDRFNYRIVDAFSRFGYGQFHWDPIERILSMQYARPMAFVFESNYGKSFALLLHVSGPNETAGVEFVLIDGERLGDELIKSEEHLKLKHGAKSRLFVDNGSLCSYPKGCLYYLEPSIEVLAIRSKSIFVVDIVLKGEGTFYAF